MSALRRVTLFTPSLVQCRFRHSPNVKKPGNIHLDRRLFEAVTMPIVPETLYDPYENCPRLKRAMAPQKQSEVPVDMVNEYEQYVLGKCRQILNHDMILVYQPTALKANEKRELKVQLLKKNFLLCFMDNEIFRKAINDSRWQHMEPLLCSHNAYVVASEIQVAAALKVTNKMSRLALLGGVVGNHVLTKEGLVAYSKLPSIEVMRGELVSILNSSASQTRSLLNQHQQTLSQHLDQYIKDQTTDS